MTSTLIFNDPYHTAQVAQATNNSPNTVVASICRVHAAGFLFGGVVYTDYTGEGGSIQMHGAGFVRNWLSRDFLWTAAHYPFVQVGVKKIFMPIKPHNYPALCLAESLGFTAEHRIRDVHPDGDIILFSMYRADCRFLALTPRTIQDTSHGQLQPGASASA